MICKRCASDSQRSFNGEIAVHFPRAQRAGQTHCLGISKACSLFSMWLRGIHRSRTRIARSRARYSCGECSGFVEKHTPTINRLVQNPLGWKQTAECSARIVEES